jgi:peptide/nickel transport system permease protein
MLSESRGGRALQYVIVLVVAISLNFFLPRFMPGNPLALLAGVDVGLLTPEERAEVMADAGLDQPLSEQYVKYWGNLLRGDFGYSYRQKQPITEMILQRLPWTLLLAGASLVVAAVVGVTAGAFSAWRRAGKADMSILWSMIHIMVDDRHQLPTILLAGHAINIDRISTIWTASILWRRDARVRLRRHGESD